MKTKRKRSNVHFVARGESAEPNPVGPHHLYPDVAWLPVSGRHHGLRESSGLRR
jgi:hypothetical protein